MHTVDTDALVIGSGFGAAAVARRLAEAGATVTIVEKGPGVGPRDFRQTQDPRYITRYLKGVSGDHLHLTFAEALGGGSGFYEMVSLRAPSLAFDQVDRSGRRLWPAAHQYNDNAFAYHLSLDNQAIDSGTDRAPRRYTDHVESRWQQGADGITWDVSLALYPDEYVDGAPDNRPVALSVGKVIGLMLAWCDNDGSELRENFVGSESVPFGSKDRGWIDADLFRKLVVVEAP